MNLYRPSIYQNDGLYEYFSEKKNVLGHDNIFDVTNYVMTFFSFFSKGDWFQIE